MNAIWTLAGKDLRLLLRDPKAAVILILMPLMFIFVLGLSLGEGFGQKPDERLRITVVDLDEGLPRKDGEPIPFPGVPWSKKVLEDLGKSGGIRVEVVDDEKEAKVLVGSGRRAAVIVFGPDFSKRVAKCSFLSEGINPFFREGVDLPALDVTVLKDDTQATAVSIIEQVAQGTMLRVVLPWMIGQAFEKIGDASFIDRLSKEKDLNVKVTYFGLSMDLKKVLQTFDGKQKEALAEGLQSTLQGLFSKYDLTAKTWDQLTKSTPYDGPGASLIAFQDKEGQGLLRRGAIRYQVLVPSYTVMFAFFLVLSVGWLFVAERRQGTIKRLAAAPLTQSQVLMGKLIPCMLVSLFQGLVLLGAGKLIFGMSWGPYPYSMLLIPLVFSTSLAAMGLAMLLAVVARTETQVAIYGTLLVLILAGVSGCLMGDRALMPETMQQISLLTPHAWALDAYRQILTSATPDAGRVWLSCAVLCGFGVGCLTVAWLNMRLV